jgi:allantoinase
MGMTGELHSVIRGNRVVTGGEIRPAAIHIEAGVITAVTPLRDEKDDEHHEPAYDGIILPGLVDTHVHINEPGRTHWEGFETATRAAAAGGVTTLIEMPLNSIPATTNLAAYREKVAAAGGKLRVDTGFWGGVVPGNASDLEPMWRAGVFGFKCFLVPSGVAEFEHVSESDLRQAMPILARLGAPLLVHAESPRMLPARPPESECEAIAMMIRLAQDTGARVHIVHLGAIEALTLIEQAHAAGIPISVETCPHYVAFEPGEIPVGASEFKCAPPIRGRLRPALSRIGMVVSDHSPSPPELKRGDYDQAWGGIASLELGLSVMATIHDSFVDLAQWMCEAPARLAGLANKGHIAPGYDADLVLFDPDRRWTVHPEALHQRNKITPYAGREMRGRVRTTYLRGEKIYDHGNFGNFATPATGRVLKR